MAPLEVFTPATLQRNDTECVTELHGFSQSANGWCVHSSSDWLAPRASTSDIFKDLRQAAVELVSEHGLHNAARAAWAARNRSLFMQDKHNDEIFAVTKSFLRSAGLQPDQSTHPNQPFRLVLLRHLLQLMQDPDIGLIDIAESGFHTGVFEPIGLRDQRDPRLSLDSTLTNVNAQVQIEEKSSSTRAWRRSFQPKW